MGRFHRVGMFGRKAFSCSSIKASDLIDDFSRLFLVAQYPYGFRQARVYLSLTGKIFQSTLQHSPGRLHVLVLEHLPGPARSQ